MIMNRRLLVLESVVLYILPPLLMLTGVLPKFFVMPLLWIGMLYALFVLRRGGRKKLHFNIDTEYLPLMLFRFTLLGIAMTLFTRYFYPDMLFSLPMQHPALWLLILLLYPLLSVLPQEIIFRAFFTHRFGTVLSHRWLFLLANAFLFAYVHALFGNLLAIVFTFLGGLIFMSTYLRTRSVAMSVIEHSLYGDLVFTLGIGSFFYHAG
jgi:uncharacterized protein